MNLNTLSGSSIAVSEATFGREFNEPLVHQVVVAYMAAARRGTKAQKTRSERRGGGKKPWRQKGTGRARAGTIRSPIWRGGGTTFAAKPRDFEQKVNRKMYRAAMRCILSELIRQDRLVIVDEFDVETHKTQHLAKKLKGIGAPESLIVTQSVEENLYRASSNIPHVDVRDVQGADPVSLIGYNKVVITVAALKEFEEVLK